MTASVRILSTSSVDSSPSILIVSPDGSKVLVNCGEGTQRCFLEHSQKISSIQAICLAHLDHTAIGGLPGLLLTYADIDANVNSPSKKIDIIGPTGSHQFIRSLRHFMQRNDFNIRVQEGNVQREPQASTGRGRRLDATTFSLRSFSTPIVDTERDQIPVAQQMTSGTKRPRSPPDSATMLTTNSSDHSANAFPLRHEYLSFLLTSSAIPGKFQPDKAIHLGVPKGPLFGQLKNGQSITFTDAGGQEVTVQSHDVVSPPMPGVAVLILYYPTRAVAEAVMALDELREALTSGCALDVVFHLANERDQMLQVIEQINRLVQPKQEETVEHIFLPLSKPDMEGTPFRAAAACAIARSSLCPDIYRIPQPPAESLTLDNLKGYRMGHTLMEYQLIPRQKKGYVSQPLLPIVEAEARALAEQSGAVGLARRIMADTITSQNSERSKGELVFTGTASSLPCKYRNVTGMGLKAENGAWLLLDIGESTIGSLLRIDADLDGRGPDELLANVKGVWISHPHADHHLGIIRLLLDRRSEDPLIIIAPPPLFRFLEDYSLVKTDIRRRYIGVNCWHLKTQNLEINKLLLDNFGFTNIRAVPVEHCAHAFAVILDGTPFGRLVYSGDCRPSSPLARAALGADLLIHEATFEDGMEAEALLKRHSTIGEALRVAREMQAKTTILTHFSQRYPKVPPVPSSGHGETKIIFAFDYMRLRPQMLNAASQLTPAIRLLFPGDDVATAGETSKMVAKTEEVLAIPGLFARPGIL